jgi:[ribosomal protein S5]-alanine N-acetyltransferase
MDITECGTRLIASMREKVTVVLMEKMMLNLTIRLDRLELIAATKELLQAEDDHTHLGHGLQAEVPSNWPPTLYDDNARQFFLAVVSENPKAVGWTTWYILVPDELDKKTLIGGVGACGLPDEDGKIVIGYSLLDQFHGKGYATEALQGFLGWAKETSRLRKVIADTFPRLATSIRVLENNGFARRGAGADEGSIRFELVIR